MSRNASAPSPFRDGFAALLHEPALLAAELAWRWCFGLSALGLGIVSIGLFLDSLKISRADEFLLGTVQPQLLESAFRHIFRGSLSRFVVEQTVLILGVIFLWSFAATAGRAATLRRLVAMFNADEEAPSMEWNFAPIFLLQLLRAMWSLIAVVVTAGLLFYGMMMAQNEHPLRAALALSFGVSLAALVGVMLNWHLGVAPLFCVRNGADTIEALDQTVEFSSRHAGRLLLLALGFFGLRLLWAGTMFLAFLSPLNLIGHIGARWVTLLMALAALVYFAGADLLYLARLAAYVSIAEDDSHRVALTEPTPPPDPAQTIDILPVVGLA